MKILFVRHAIAEDRKSFSKKNKNDDDRPLTQKGKKEFSKFSKKIKTLYPKIDDLYSSPLIRALQTTEILKKRYNKAYKIQKELRPDVHPCEIVKKLKKSEKKLVVCVGHEPHLSQTIGYIITGRVTSIIKLRKGGVCLVDLTNAKILRVE